jgi:histone H3/H4
MNPPVKAKRAKRDVKVGVPKKMVKRIAAKMLGAELRMTDAAHLMISDLVTATITKVVMEADKLQKTSKPSRKTITHESIYSAVKLVFPPEVAGHAVSAGVQAVTEFNKNRSGSGKMVDFQKSSGQDIRTFATASRVLKRFSCLNKSELSRVALSGVCQYMLEEILEISVIAMRGSKKVTMSDKHVFLALQNDYDLIILHKNVSGKGAMGGGVMPNIHAALTYKPRK